MRLSLSVVSQCGSLPGLAGRMSWFLLLALNTWFSSAAFISPCTLSVVKPSLGLDGLHLTLHHLLQVTCHWPEWEALPVLLWRCFFFRKSELDWHFPDSAACVSGASGSAFCASTQHPSLSEMALVSMLMISDTNLHLNRQRRETSIRRCRESQVVSGLPGSCDCAMFTADFTLFLWRDLDCMNLNLDHDCEIWLIFLSSRKTCKPWLLFKVIGGPSRILLTLR